MKAVIITLTVVALAIALDGPVGATDRDDEAGRTLVGISQLGVIVDDMPADAARYDLRRADVQADVEQFLRERRVKVIARDKLDAQMAYLRVRCDLVPLEKEQRLVYAVSLDLLQSAVLTNGHHVHASTWNECQAGITRRPSPDDVRAAVKDAAGVFVNAYLEANPRPGKNG